MSVLHPSLTQSRSLLLFAWIADRMDSTYLVMCVFIFVPNLPAPQMAAFRLRRSPFSVMASVAPITVHMGRISP